MVRGTVCPPHKRYYIIYISILFCNLLFSPHIRPHNIDLTAHFPHARTRSRIAASVSKRAQATQRVTQPPQPLWPAKGATGAGCGVRLAVWGLQERHLYLRINFKLNRAAALAEWRQLLSA